MGARTRAPTAGAARGKMLASPRLVRSLSWRPRCSKSSMTASRRRVTVLAAADPAVEPGTTALSKAGTQIGTAIIKAAARAAQGPVFVAGAWQGVLATRLMAYWVPLWPPPGPPHAARRPTLPPTQHAARSTPLRPHAPPTPRMQHAHCPACQSPAAPPPLHPRFHRASGHRRI